jgi:hypothetical protein
LLEETSLLGARPIDIPMDPNQKIVKDEGELFEDPGRYRRLVGKLITLLLLGQTSHMQLVLLVSSWRLLGFHIGKLLLVLFDI